MADQAPTQAPTRSRRPAVLASDPVLTSKITVPSVPDWAVSRPRITRLIAEGTRWCPLTVVTGPPGAGKTMALALWAAAEAGAVAWVGLDEFDNRPGVFWSYVVAALRQSGVAIPKALRAMSQERQGEDGFLLRLTAALAAQDPPVTLVLDDLHPLTDPGALKGLEFVLRNVGSGLRLLVASRMDPLLPLHRYRLAGQLTEIRASDLAFSLDEAGLLLDQHGGLLTADAPVGVVRSGLAGPAAEPDRVASIRGGRRRPGCSDHSRTGRHLAGGGGHPRPGLHDLRRRRGRTTSPRSRPGGRRPGTGPGAPAGVAGGRPARL